MYSVQLKDSNNLNVAINWVMHNEINFHNVQWVNVSHYCSDAVEFVKKTRANPDITWCYQTRGISENGREKTCVYMLFISDAFALSFKLMGF